MKEIIPGKSWYWLLAPDSSLATVDTIMAIEMNDKVTITHTHTNYCNSSQEPGKRSASKSQLSEAINDITTDDNNKKNSIPGKSWYWLLAADG